MDLVTLAAEIKTFHGVTRKRTISNVVDFFPSIPQENILAAYGEDCAVIMHNGSELLLAADGIMETLMKIHPFYAGYFAVLVNIHDVAAMGGIPLAMVDIVSSKDEKVCAEVMKGMESAVRKFGVPIVGGHTHPDCEYNAIDVAILGTVDAGNAIFSHTAESGDDIIMAIDLDGFFPETLPYAWDTTSKKTAEHCREQLLLMNKIGKLHLAKSAKDISNPGCLGTLGMLLETSGVGAEVYVDKIPIPPKEDPIQWMKAYQGCGYVLTCDSNNSQKIIDIFAEGGLDAVVVGSINDSKKLVLKDDTQSVVLFDFSIEKITGCNPSKLPSNVKLKR